MSKQLSKLSLFSVTFLSLMLAIPASATTITLTGGLSSGQSGAANTDFESGVPAGWSFTGTSGVVSGSVSNVYLTPAGDASKYAYVGIGGTATAIFSTPITYFGLYWGSTDYYNKITLTDVNGVSTSYNAGSGILSGLNVDSWGTQFVNFFDDGAAWKSVVFESGGPAFEFDNVATATTIPEPATLALLAGGLVAAGVLRRRKSS